MGPPPYVDDGSKGNSHNLEIMMSNIMKTSPSNLQMQMLKLIPPIG